MKYWSRMAQQKTNNILLLEAYYMCIAENHSWLRGLKHMLYCNCLGDLCLQVCNITTSKLGSTVQQRLEDQYVQKWNDHASNDPNLKLLSSLKNEYTQSHYLKSVTSIKERTQLTKLRQGL